MSHYSLSSAGVRLGASRRISIMAWLMASVDAWRSRRQLESLDTHMLEDIGLSASQAQSEANRPVWDVPAHWVK